MTFSDFKNYVPKIEKLDYSSEEAHLEIAPNFRSDRLKDIEIKARNPKNAGVVALCYPNKYDEACLTLILRNTYNGVHSAQIGFPGGREELIDNDIKDTALRETFEEVGVRPAQIKIIKDLTRLYIPPSNFWVYPFFGVCQSRPKFRRQESEVNQILEVKLQDILDDGVRSTKTLSTSYAKNVDVPAFVIQEQIIWGATGMMLNEVKGIIKSALAR